jgi:hypothetical protein
VTWLDEYGMAAGSRSFAKEAIGKFTNRASAAKALAIVLLALLSNILHLG